jgi:hypothetical protein
MGSKRSRVKPKTMQLVIVAIPLNHLSLQYQDIVEIYSVSVEKIINDGFSYSENV